MRFRADQHLRRTSDFHHVRTQGRRYDCGAFVLYYAPRSTPAATPSHEASAPATADAPPPARAGFVASRSAVGNAVARARAKRRLRERFRLHQLAFPPGIDLVFVARRSLNRLEPAALDQRFLDLCRRVFPPRAS
jgi:ribonuclease P protein component, eubacterial